jgi:peptide/nickel transport system permease protein
MSPECPRSEGEAQTMTVKTDLGDISVGWIKIGPIRVRARSNIGLVLRALARNEVTWISGLVILVTVLMAIFSPMITPYPPNKSSLMLRLKPPSAEHWFGNDATGRDVFSRVLAGTRFALQIGLVAVTIGLVPGVVLGLTSAYLGSYWDLVITRITDIMLAFPYFLAAIVIVTVLGPSLLNAIIAVGIYNAPIFIRLVRSAALSVKEEDYVLSARMIGASDLRIILKHILPNVLSPIIVQTTLTFPRSILSASSLGFLGLGAQPPTPEWGTEVAASRQYFILAPHTVFFPILAIAIVSLAFNFLGDGLRDVLDPRTRYE